MKKIALLIVSLVLVNLAGNGLAQQTELPAPGLTPDSPFYFLKIFFEDVGTFFTFGDFKKAERYARLAEKRIAEAKAMIEKGKPETTEKVLKKYQDQLTKSLAQIEKTKAKGKNMEKVTETIAQTTGRHTLVLEELLEKVPEQAKGAIIKAKEASLTGQKNGLRFLAGENPERATEINLKTVEARLNRAKAKAEKGEIEEAENAIQEFENQYKFGEEISQIARDLNKDITTVEQLVGKVTSIHLEILAEIYEKVPEQAKEAIEKAMEISIKGHQRAVEVLKEKNTLAEVPEEVSLPEKVPEIVKKKIYEIYIIHGWFTEKTTEEDIENFQKKLKDFEAKPYIIGKEVHFPMQFEIPWLTKKTCSEAREILATLKYVQSFSKCLQKPLLLKAGTEINYVLSQEGDCEYIIDPINCFRLDSQACQENQNCRVFRREGACDCPKCEFLTVQCLPR